MCATPYNVLHVRAPHDVNGNPRRAFMVLFHDGTHAFFDEGYLGESVIPADYRDRVVTVVNVSVRELARLRKGAN